MAALNFANLKQTQNNSSGNYTGPRFFNKLKDDGEEIIVRFIENDAQKFEINTIHPGIPVNGSYRDVNCIRELNEPIEKCPLCCAKQSDGKPYRIAQKIFVKMLVYEQDSTGKISPVPMVWSRPTSFAYELNSFMENYGPLENIICKIIRHGAKGDMHTTYQIVPNLSKQIYRDDVYVKDTSAFENYKALGRMIINRDADAIRSYLATGNFPIPNREPIAPMPTDADAPFQGKFVQPSVQPADAIANTDPVTLPWTQPSSTPVEQNAQKFFNTNTPSEYTPPVGYPNSMTPAPTPNEPQQVTQTTNTPTFTPNPSTPNFPWMNNGNTMKFGGR